MPDLATQNWWALIVEASRRRRTTEKTSLVVAIVFILVFFFFFLFLLIKTLWWEVDPLLNLFSTCEIDYVGSKVFIVKKNSINPMKL